MSCKWEQNVRRDEDEKVKREERTYGDRHLIRNDLAILVNVDDRLVLNLILHRRHVKPVYFVPIRHAVLNVRRTGEGRKEDRGLRGDHETAGGEPLVAGVEDGVEHAFVEEAVTLSGGREEE